LSVAECGTPSGYQRHHRAGEYACDPCKAAHAAYVAEYNADPERTVRRRQENLARGRALQRLAKSFPAEYGVLLVEERKRLGMGPPRKRAGTMSRIGGRL